MTRALLLTLLALLLASCTGSIEQPNPVLLITTFTRTAEPPNAVGIIRDNLAIGARDRFEFLPDSFKTLPAPPQSFDLTNRADARNILVVLSRAEAEPPATVPASFLSLFTTSRLDGSEDDPDVTGFKEARRIDFSNITGTAIIPRNFPNRDTPLYCPSKVQVSQGGNYAAVLNVPNNCGFVGSQNFIDILDITGTGRLLQRINGVEEGGLYVSQSSSADVLYYATRTAGTLSLLRVSLPRPGQAFGPDDTVGTPQLVGTVRAQLSQGNFVDFGIAGEAGSEHLVVLFQSALTYVRGYTGEGTEEGPVRTAGSDNALILRDDLLGTSETLVLGGPLDATDRLSVFPSSLTTDEGNTDSGERRARVYASAGTINSSPNSGYAYFAGTDPTGLPSLSLLDLNAYSTGTTPSVQPYVEGLSGLAPSGGSWSPTFLTWVQSLPPVTQ